MHESDAQALTYLEQALEISRAIDNPALRTNLLSQIADIHRRNGNDAAALHCYEECLELAVSAGQRSEAGLLHLLIARAERGRGHPEAAVAHYREALPALDQAVAPALKFDAWNEYGDLQHQLASYSAALESYRVALDVAGALGDAERESAVWNNIGMVHFHGGAYREALDALERSQAIWRASGESSSYREAVLLNNLGEVHTALGAFDVAAPLYDEALGRARAGGHLALEAAVLNNRGELRRLSGDPRGAMRDYEASLRLREQTGDEPGRARVLNNLGLVYNHLGDCGRALQRFFEALAIHRAHDHRLDESSTLNNIGTACRRTGDYDKALRYFHEASAIQEAIGARGAAAPTIDNIGQIHRAERRYTNALESFRTAYAIRKDIGDKRGMVVTLTSIAGILQDMGARDDATARYVEALDIAREIGDLVAEGAVLNNLATVHQERGNLQAALSAFGQALDVRTRAGDAEGQQQTLLNLGYLHERLHQPDEALRCYRDAIDALDRLRIGAGGAEERETLVEKHIHAYQLIVDLLVARGNVRAAFDYAERSRARSLADLLHEAAAGIGKSLDPVLIQERGRLHETIADTTRRLASADDTERRSLTAERARLQHELDRVRHQIRARAPKYADLLFAEPVSIEQVQEEVLRPRELLLEFFEAAENLYIFVVSRRSMSLVTVANKRAVVDAVRALIGPLHASEPERFDAGLAYSLYQRVFAPVDAQIGAAGFDEAAGTLIVAPDGVLAYLPFEMLVTTPPDVAGDGSGCGQTTFLANRFSFVYTASATTLAMERRSRERPSQATAVLAVAPFANEGHEALAHAKEAARETVVSDTVRTALENAAPLPNSFPEVQSVSAMYDGSACYVGVRATKDAVRAGAARGYRYLHFATHGHLDSDQPMYSGLLLADGILQAWEIFDLDMQAEMVVMSACESGLGKLRRGEGLVGLTRAFFHAGVRSLVVSLWRVSDVSTQLLMTRMYMNLKNGMAAAQALREARTWMLREARQLDDYGYERTFESPFYWAPFILTGAYDSHVQEEH